MAARSTHSRSIADTNPRGIASITQDPYSDENIEDLSRETGFILLREDSAWRMYHHPVEIVSATNAEELSAALSKVDDHNRQGGESAGVMFYEAGYALEPKLLHLLKAAGTPLCWFGLYGPPTFLPHSFKPQILTPHFVLDTAELISQQHYETAVNDIRALILAGDVYQVNFTYRLAFRLGCTAWQWFASLYHNHAVPYAAFINTGDQEIVSLSPELFFRLRGKRITAKPMKGTALRGLTAAEDRDRAHLLANSAKDRAENVMIVDLMRNDLGKIAYPGSVRTPRLCEIEQFPTLWQMTSTIESIINGDCTPQSILKALFPSGSVTGAPKIRAMEIISDLETSARGVYTGAIGYFSAEEAQFNVAIRTAVVNSNEAMMGVGSGITSDSQSDSEWQECKSKSRFVEFRQPEFSLIETLLWAPAFWLLEEHLDRLRASAEYFGYPFNEQEIRRALHELGCRLGNKATRVRLLLTERGSCKLETKDREGMPVGRIRLASRRVLSSDRFLRHKTTYRQVYDSELTAARLAGFDDCVFFNEGDELTEGCIHNVFLLIEGELRTPPLKCGVLAGTYRRHLLKCRPGIREEILKSNDLNRADAIYLTNSVQGMFLVKLFS